MPNALTTEIASSRSPLRRRLLSLLACAGMVTVFGGCATIATFDQISYEKATAAKAEALALMDQATGPYRSHRREIAEVALTLDKAYEYDRGRDLNAETVRLWQLLRDPEGNLYGGFLRRWKEKGALKPDAIALKKPDIADAFDQIIGLEIGKRRVTTN